MGAKELGDLCEVVRQARGWSLARMAYEIGLVPPDDKALNESQAKRILEGRRRVDWWMVERLITVFALDPAEAWAAAGLLPPGVTADMLRKLDLVASLEPATAGVGPDALTHWLGNPQGHVKAMGRLIPFPVRPPAALQAVA